MKAVEKWANLLLRGVGIVTNQRQCRKFPKIIFLFNIGRWENVSFSKWQSLLLVMKVWFEFRALGSKEKGIWWIGTDLILLKSHNGKISGTVWGLCMNSGFWDISESFRGFSDRKCLGSVLYPLVCLMGVLWIFPVWALDARLSSISVRHIQSSWQLLGVCLVF